MRVLGIDPSLTATGIAYPDGTLTTIGGDAKHGDHRLTRIYQAVATAAVTGADLAVLEDLPTHAHGAGITGMAQGVIRLALQTSSVPYVTVAAATLKKYATGSGAATKADMRMALFKRATLDVRDDNQCDAWWLRAMGMQHLGQPLLVLPATHLAAMTKVAWPARERVA